MADNDIKEDGRNPGQELAGRIKEDLNTATVIQLEPNLDVNDTYLKYGSGWFTERLTAWSDQSSLMFLASVTRLSLT